jgi:hypothetical protein
MNVTVYTRSEEELLFNIPRTSLLILIIFHSLTQIPDVNASASPGPSLDYLFPILRFKNIPTYRRRSVPKMVMQYILAIGANMEKSHYKQELLRLAR